MGYFYGLLMCGVGVVMGLVGFSGCGFGCKCIIMFDGYNVLWIIDYGLLMDDNTNMYVFCLYIVCIVWCRELGIYICVYIDDMITQISIICVICCFDQ